MQSLDLKSPTPVQILFSPDGRSLATVGGDNAVHLWELASRELRTSFSDPRTLATVAAFSPDGKLLVTGHLDHTIRSWDLVTGGALQRLEQPGAVTALAWSPDGRTLASGCNDTTAYIWDAAPLRRKVAQPALKLDGPTQERLWTDLSGDSAVKASAAMRQLAAAPKEAVPLVKDRLTQLVQGETKQLEEWLAKLDSDQFEERERATRELTRLGRRAEAPLRKILEGKPSPELRRRATSLLDKIGKEPARSSSMPVTALALVRSVELLEQLDTSEARAVLKQWADGADDAPLTREAKAALKRRRKP